MLNASIRKMALVSIAALVAGCAHTSSVIDRSETRTVFRKISLEQYPYLKVLLGGAVRHIPLKDVRMVKIDASESTVFEREIYFTGELVLRDGSVLSMEGSEPDQGKCYICVNNTLVGKRRGETFKIPLESIMQIKFEDD
jgi:hypothetical protein